MNINPGTGKEYTSEELEIDSVRRARRKAIDDELPYSEIDRLTELHTALVKAYMDKRAGK